MLTAGSFTVSWCSRKRGRRLWLSAKFTTLLLRSVTWNGRLHFTATFSASAKLWICPLAVPVWTDCCGYDQGRPDAPSSCSKG